MEKCLTHATPHAGRMLHGHVASKGTFRTGRVELYEKFALLIVYPILCHNKFAIKRLKLFNFNRVGI